MTHGIVATPHRLASEAAAQVLRDGGNAIDAAVTANAVLCVVYPHMTSIGGDLFALVWPAGEREPIGLEGAGKSGAGASIRAVRDAGHETMPVRGPLTITVPGTVMAWGRLLERYGTIGFGRALEAAIGFARDGFIVGDDLGRAFAEAAHWLLREADTAKALPPLKTGMLFRQPELAGALEQIGRRGFGGFYFGELGAAIAEAVQKRGGFLTAADLAAHRSTFVKPLAMDFRGFRIHQLPPPTQGLVAMSMLARLQTLGDPELEPGPAFARRFVKIRDAAYALRERYITDPAFAEIPVAPFLDPHLNPGTLSAPLPAGDTVYLCTADEKGNVVSLIQSIAFDFGSGVVADGTGIILQNRGCYFSLDPQHVNRLEPGKRTMHTLIPALASRNEVPVAAFGNMAGEGQPQILAQVAVNLFARGQDPELAVSEPRLRVAAEGTPLWVEADYPGAGELNRAQEPPTLLLPPRSSRMGHAQALLIDGRGHWRGGADPRSDGSVEVV